MQENQFDSFDLQIMDALSKDARIAFTQLADQLGVSNSFIHQRYRKLKDAGVLERAVYRLDALKLGYTTCAYVQIILTHSQLLHDAVEEIRKIVNIVECVNLAGRYDLMVKIYARDNSHLRDIIYDRIQSMKGVEGTNTVIVFETNFLRPVPVL